MAAYAVMNNHFYLAVELTEPTLSVGMKWLQGTWAQRFNRYRGRVGRPFQGRFKALLAEPGECYGRVVHYIHFNPVRAKLVGPEGVARFPWSSLPRFRAKKRGAQLDGRRFAGLEPEVVQEERRAAWEARLQQLAAAARVDLTRLGLAKSAPAKALLAAAMKSGTSVSNAWLAERLQMGQPASASQFARRWLLQANGQAAVKDLLSRVKT